MKFGRKTTTESFRDGRVISTKVAYEQSVLLNSAPDLVAEILHSLEVTKGSELLTLEIYRKDGQPTRLVRKYS